MGYYVFVCGHCETCGYDRINIMVIQAFLIIDDIQEKLVGKPIPVIDRLLKVPFVGLPIAIAILFGAFVTFIKVFTCFL